MTLTDIIKTAINPALAILPMGMDSPKARVMLLATGLQESRFEYRRQMGNGPARGFWQFERGGGVMGVLCHTATKALALDVCKARDVPPDSSLVHARLEFDDVLAAAFARLLLWADRAPLPGVDADHETAWQCYLRNWRPGRPHRETWDAFHAQARAQVLA